jgi:hypothetical protein
MSTKAATLEYVPPYIRLRCAADARLVKQLRALLRRARHWSHDERTWILAAEYGDWLESVLTRLSYHVVWCDGQSHASPVVPEPYRVLHGSPSAPAAVVNTAYRSLAPSCTIRTPACSRAMKPHARCSS